MIALNAKPASTEAATWQERFLKMMPRIRRHARFAFRHLDPEAQEDAVTDVVANAMVAYRRLHERGKLQRAFASVLAKYAVAQYRRGQRVGTPQRAGDVFSPMAKKRGGYEVCQLGAPGEQTGAWMESLIDNRRTPVPKQAAFRIDFPRWLDGLTFRDRRIAERLSLGYSTSDVADEFGLSRGRVSQLRRELAGSWREFGRARSVQAEEV